MATVTTSGESGPPREEARTFSQRFNWNYFLLDNITGSRALTIWIGFLAVATLAVAVTQLNTAPVRAGILIGLWLLAVLMTIGGELYNLHTPVSRWLKENMLNSVSNTVITLLIALVVGIVFAALWDWGYTSATFSTSTTAPDVRSTGASWGVVWGAKELLLTGTLGKEHTWRVLLTIGMIGLFWLLTWLSSRPGIKEKSPGFLKTINFLWLLSPIIAFVFLAGIEYEAPLFSVRPLLTGLAAAAVLMVFLWFFRVIQLNPIAITSWLLAWPIGYLIWRLVAQSAIFPSINVDDWGGLLLTVILAVFVNVISFPIGIFLALGRRADVQGIPVWITWPIALLAAGWFLTTSTPDLWETSRNGIERVLSLWPLLIIVATYYFHHSFEGNVVKAFSILSIELIRGVPLITLLFMAIVMAPFFTASGSSIKTFWAVIIGYSIFSSAYMAELVRGGLQAIPRGQYEASDAVGLNTLQKYRFIILPQALRILIPPLAGAVIGTFKSSSLVALVGMLDLVGIVRGIIANPEWLGLRSELYAFMFVLYFLVSSVVSAYSRRLEERTGLGVR